MDRTDGVEPFERGGAYDSGGQPDLAVPLYREALERGLPDGLRRRAVIQLAGYARLLTETGPEPEAR